MNTPGSGCERNEFGFDRRSCRLSPSSPEAVVEMFTCFWSPISTQEIKIVTGAVEHISEKFSAQKRPVLTKCNCQERVRKSAFE